MLALEIHDAGLLTAFGDGEAPSASEESPGFALLEGTALRTGLEAARRARRMPRAVHSRFWQHLSLDPAGRPFPGDWSLADLAHAHLEEVWSRHPPLQKGAVLALSSAYSSQQLGILLGIFKASHRPVVGLMDSAVVAVRAAGLEGRVLYLDPHLHRFTLTATVAGSQIVGGATQTLAHVGLEDLQQLWARHIAETLVRRTRFDPLHAGATEQTLHDRLPGWLAEAERGKDFEAHFEGSGGDFRATVSRSRLIAAVEEPYGKILQGVRDMLRQVGRASLLLSHRGAQLPGLASRLEALCPGDLATLPRGAVARSALEVAQSLGLEASGSGAAVFLRRLKAPKPTSGNEHGPA